MKKVSSIYWNPVSRITLFLFIFIISLFLGDGKQMGLDIYWPLVTLGTIPLWEGSKSKNTLPWFLICLFSLLIGTSIISTLFSWSPGYSVSYVMRTLVALIWLIRFTALTKQETYDFVTICVYTSLFFAPTALIILLFPTIGLFQTPLNLIGSANGHLAISYLALAILPLSLYLARTDKAAIIPKLAVISILSTICISFARVPMILASLFLVVSLCTGVLKKSVLRTVLWCFVIVLLSIVSFVFWTSIQVPSIRQQLPISSLIRSFVLKDPIQQDARFSFIAQSVDAFRTRPIFGTGPGTFSLISRQYAPKYTLMSYDAHNAFVQIFSEYGLVGTFLLLCLLVWISNNVYRSISTTRQQHDTYREQTALLLSATLLILLSVFEQTLDRYGILLLLGALLGASYIPHAKQKMCHYRYSILSLQIVLALYCISWISSDIAFRSSNTPLSFLLAPYRESTTINLIESKTTISDWQHALMHTFHPRDPEIDIVLANATSTYSDKRRLYQKAILESPHNPFIERDYLYILSGAQDPNTVCREVLRYTQVSELSCGDKLFVHYINSPQFLNAAALLTSDDGLPKFLYRMGLDLVFVPNELPTSIILWARARDLAPNWGYYHVELATLIAMYNHTKYAATPTLLHCLTNPYSKALCQYTLEHINNLPLPGTYANDIAAIPVILTNK
jgi:O-antigen ligase